MVGAASVEGVSEMSCTVFAEPTIASRCFRGNQRLRHHEIVAALPELHHADVRHEDEQTAMIEVRRSRLRVSCSQRAIRRQGRGRDELLRRREIERPTRRRKRSVWTGVTHHRRAPRPIRRGRRGQRRSRTANRPRAPNGRPTESRQTSRRNECARGQSDRRRRIPRELLGAHIREQRLRQRIRAHERRDDRLEVVSCTARRELRDAHRRVLAFYPVVDGETATIVDIAGENDRARKRRQPL